MISVKGKWALITGAARGIGAFLDDKKSGRIFGAQAFAGLTLAEAAEKAQKEFDSPY